MLNTDFKWIKYISAYQDYIIYVWYHAQSKRQYHSKYWQKNSKITEILDYRKITEILDSKIKRKQKRNPEWKQNNIIFRNKELVPDGTPCGI